MDKLKVVQNEKGQVIVTLPVSGEKVTLRSPKGKDLKALDRASQENLGNVGLMMLLATQLAVEPVLTMEDLDEMDADDVGALGVALGNFRSLRSR